MSQKQRVEELRKKRKKQRESLMSFFKRFQDRLSRFQKIDEPTKSETVGDAQKMRTRTKTSMADAQKMRKALFNSIKNRAVQGTAAGKWSARKAQLLAKTYKARGGGYT